MQISGAHVLVTGASRGIGAQLALQAAERGATCTLVGRSEPALREQAAALSGRALVCDLADPAARVGLLDRAEAAAGRPVDVLVNCAGVDGIGGLLEVGAEQVHELYQVNLVAPVELVRQALPGMVARRRGHLLTVSSGFSTFTGPGLVPYASSKAGLSHFHGGLRLELRGTGIGTTLVEPGPVDTGMFGRIEAHRLTRAVMHRFLALQATRLVRPEDVARAALDAVEAGRRHVVPPRRMTPALALDWIPRRVADLLLTGVPRRCHCSGAARPRRLELGHPAGQRAGRRRAVRAAGPGALGPDPAAAGHRAARRLHHLLGLHGGRRADARRGPARRGRRRRPGRPRRPGRRRLGRAPAGSGGPVRLQLAVALGASLGAPTRYLVDVALRVRWGDRLPWGTLAVNLVGSAAAGVVAGVRPGGLVTALVAIGFIGAFTTASTLVADLGERARSGWAASAGLLALHVVLGLLLAGAGLLLGRALG